MNDSIIQWVGIAAGFLTSISLLPQVVKIHRERNAEQISIPYLALLLAGLGLWILYGVERKDIPVIATNIFSAFVACVTLILKLKYRARA